jgi:hypothetical protein
MGDPCFLIVFVWSVARVVLIQPFAWFPELGKAYQVFTGG